MISLFHWIRRQLGLIPSDYADRITWPQYWDKPAVSVHIAPFPGIAAGVHDALHNAAREAVYLWSVGIKEMGESLVVEYADSAEPADITIRFGHLYDNHRGWTHADPDEARRNVRQKTSIVIADRLRDPAAVRRVALHELGHAFGVGAGHSSDPGDVLYSPVRANGLSWRDKNTMPKVWAKARELDGKRP